MGPAGKMLADTSVAPHHTVRHERTMHRCILFNYNSCRLSLESTLCTWRTNFNNLGISTWANMHQKCPLHKIECSSPACIIATTKSMKPWLFIRPCLYNWHDHGINIHAEAWLKQIYCTYFDDREIIALFHKP